MRYKIASLAAAAIVLGGVQIAPAADMAVKAPMAAPVPYLFNWTGLYLGVNAGWGFDRRNIDLAPGTGMAVFFAANEFPTSIAPDANGFIGGGQIGYNWQMQNFVYGIEADFQGSAIKGNQTLSPTPVIFVPFNTNGEKKLTWFGTVRGRLGLAANNWLFYVTGGLAYGETELSLNTVPVGFACGPGFTCAIGSTSKVRAGWTAGGGVEYGLTPNWILRAEYLYIDLGSLSQNVTGSAGPGFVFIESTRFNEHIVRGAISYKF